MLYLDQKKRQAEIDRKRDAKHEQELKACTFKPKLNRKKSQPNHQNDDISAASDIPRLLQDPKKLKSFGPTDSPDEKKV